MRLLFQSRFELLHTLSARKVPGVITVAQIFSYTSVILTVSVAPNDPTWKKLFDGAERQFFVHHDILLVSLSIFRLFLSSS